MTNKNNYDFIVLGLGAMGSSTCYQLAKQGFSVLGLEQFSPLHNFGSSHGETRIIRQAYFEHENYIPLLKRSYELWREFENQIDEKIFNQTGLVLFADPDKSILFQESLKSAKKYNIPVEVLKADDCIKRWPNHQPTANLNGLYEPTGGFLFCERIIHHYQQQSLLLGAHLQFNKNVTEILPKNGSVHIKTQSDNFYAKKIIITAGPWSGKLLSPLKIPLIIKRKFLTWFETKDKYSTKVSQSPCFGYHIQKDFFYGFPSVDNKTFKLAEHFSGEIISDPKEKDLASIPTTDLDNIINFVRKYLPFATDKLNQTASCLYTLTPDEHFILDKHPDSDHIIIACGFSGHGFKFSSVIGEILADLAIKNITKSDIDFFKLARFL